MMPADAHSPDAAVRVPGLSFHLENRGGVWCVVDNVGGGVHPASFAERDMWGALTPPPAVPAVPVEKLNDALEKLWRDGLLGNVEFRRVQAAVAALLPSKGRTDV